MRLKICCRTSTLQGQSIVAGAGIFFPCKDAIQDTVLQEDLRVEARRFDIGDSFGFFSRLRKAVRRTDSLLFATEGRIGGLGESGVFGAQISLCPWEEGGEKEPFSGLCTVLQFDDGGVSIPPWSFGRGRFGD